MRRLARALLYAGTVALVLGLGHIHAVYIGHYPTGASSRLAWELAYSAALGVAAYAVGLPDLARNAYHALWLALCANVVAAAAISFVQLGLGVAILPRFVVFWTASLLVPGYALCAFVAARGRREERRRDRVLAILTPSEAAMFTDDLRHAERKASLARVLNHDEVTADSEAHTPLLDAFSQVDASILVLDRRAQNDESIVAQAAQLHSQGVRIRTLSLFYDEWVGKLPLSELERVALMFDIGELHRIRYGRVKRLVDGVVAAAGLVVMVVVIPFVLAANSLGNRGPLFFRQPRVGKGGEIFTMLKFRTMVPDSGDGTWTADGDTRITRVGSWLRRTHLDELPQVINILRGDQAIVGPRPEQPRYVSALREKIPFYDLRHLTRPGLTGWAQLNYHYGATEIDALEKLQYEFYYLRHQSLALDLRIIVRTIRQVVGRGGR
ncbi:MAG TPA: sugar transferase [Acidimicrobiales bacterium]|nr:sugar transferase [Acidimicrobiales bacterium]